MPEQEIGLTQSFLIEEMTPRRELQDTQNAKLIMGTANRGPLNVPVRITKEDNIKDIFGDDPNPASKGFETSLIRAYYEIMNSTVGDIDVRLLRIGDAKKASATYYENPDIISGAFSATEPPAPSISVEAMEEGRLGTEIRASFTNAKSLSAPDGGSYVVPTAFILEIPDGYNTHPLRGQTLTFALNPFDAQAFASFGNPEEIKTPEGGTVVVPAGSIASIVDLADAINAVAGDIVRAKVSLLEAETDITILARPDGSPKRSYQLTGGTFANRLRDIMSITEVRDLDDELGSGGTVLSFTYPPRKDPDGILPTITSWYRYPKMESVIVVTPDTEGATQAYLSCTKVDYWIDGLGDSLMLTPTAERPDLGIYGKRSTEEMTKLVDGTDYTIDTSTGQVTFITDDPTAFFYNPDFAAHGTTGLILGDAVYATYVYKVDYNEAHTRSELAVGDPTSFFIIGKDVVFGAGQAIDLVASFTAYIPYALENVIPGDIIENPTLYDYRRGLYSGVFTFKDIGKSDIGKVFRVSYKYEPEFPAQSGTYLDIDGDGDPRYLQPAGLTGGTDGIPVDRSDYKEALVRGYEAVDNYPFTAILPMGAYLDDTFPGYDQETGLPTNVPVNYHVDLATAVRRKSRLVKECNAYMTVRPPNKSVLTPEEERAYIDRLVNISETDPNRPANIMNGINEFRLNVVAGTPLISLTDMTQTNGIPFVANAANVYVGMKNDVPLTRSMVNIPLPPQMQEFAVKISKFNDVGSLQAMRYTPMVFSVTKNSYIVADAPTMADPRSNLRRQYVLDVVLMAINLVREVGDIYIGQAYTSMNINAMRKNMGGKVKFMVPDMLRNFHLEIVGVPDGYITGKTKVRLVLTTSVEIMSVDITTQVKLGM